MIVNRENYEAFLLDLMEGNLSDDQENILKHFLEENPDLIVDDNFTFSFKVPESGISLPDKEGLKKGGANSVVNEGNYEQFCIARLEGDLSGEAESRLDRFLYENPGFGKSAEAFRSVILKADKSIGFPGKNTLKKVYGITVAHKDYFKRRYIYKAVSIAASIAIMISVFNSISDNTVADQTVNQDNQNVSITGDQSTLKPNQIPAPDIVQERSSVENADMADMEFRETHRPEARVPLLSAVKESASDIPRQMASREPVLLPVKNISPVQAKITPANFSPEIVRPEHTAVILSEPSINERSGAGMILSGLIAFATRNFNEDEQSGGLNLWKVADAGFRGINTLTGSELRLEREFNQEGELVSMAFSSRLLEFRRTSLANDN
jgi:hypothetical protein